MPNSKHHRHQQPRPKQKIALTPAEKRRLFLVIAALLLGIGSCAEAVFIHDPSHRITCAIAKSFCE
jgi:hypothetical protein